MGAPAPATAIPWEHRIRAFMRTMSALARVYRPASSPNTSPASNKSES